MPKNYEKKSNNFRNKTKESLMTTKKDGKILDIYIFSPPRPPPLTYFIFFIFFCMYVCMYVCVCV